MVQIFNLRFLNICFHFKLIQMEATEKILQTLASFKSEYLALRTKLEQATSWPDIRREWIPRQELMHYLGYGSTQMAAISKQYNLTSTKIGKRIFYSKKQILTILSDNAK